MSTIRHPGLMVADGYEIYPILFLGQADLAELLWRNYLKRATSTYHEVEQTFADSCDKENHF